jgi:pilus assembly protein CpaE
LWAEGDDVVGKQPGQARALLWIESPEAPEYAVVETVARELGLRAWRCARGDIAAAMAAEPLDLIGVDLGEPPLPGLQLLRDLHERFPRLTLFAASPNNSPELIRAVIEAGAADVVSQPLNAAELSRALIKLTELSARPAPLHTADEGEIITVYGARGGLGTTTLAVNLAARLASLARRVALVDLDLQRGDVAAFLNLTPSQSIGAIAGAPGEIDELFLHQTLTRHASGVFVLPAPAQILDADSIAHDRVAEILRLLRREFQHTIVDTPRALTETMLPGMELADRILILSDLSVPGARAARRIVELLARIGIHANRVDLIITEAVPGPVKIEEAIAAIGKTPLAVLPRDEAAGQAMNSGSVLNGARPVGLSAAIGELAARLAHLSEASTPRRGRLLGRFFGRAKKGGA